MSGAAPEIHLELLSDFDDYGWDAKGYYPADALIDGHPVKIYFYDPTRLAQDIEDDVRSSGFFEESHLVVIPQVNRETIMDVARRLSFRNYPAEQD